jgi:hypothetical protein
LLAVIGNDHRCSRLVDPTHLASPLLLLAGVESDASCFTIRRSRPDIRSRRRLTFYTSSMSSRHPGLQEPDRKARSTPALPTEPQPRFRQSWKGSTEPPREPRSSTCGKGRCSPALYQLSYSERATNSHHFQVDSPISIAVARDRGVRHCDRLGVATPTTRATWVRRLREPRRANATRYDDGVCGGDPCVRTVAPGRPHWRH